VVISPAGMIRVSLGQGQCQNANACALPNMYFLHARLIFMTI